MIVRLHFNVPAIVTLNLYGKKDITDKSVQLINTSVLPQTFLRCLQGFDVATQDLIIWVFEQVTFPCLLLLCYSKFESDLQSKNMLIWQHSKADYFCQCLIQATKSMSQSI